MTEREAASHEGLEFRVFEGPDDDRQGVELQRLTWGRDFAECVPPGLLAIIRRTGGVVAGAFSDDGLLQGFVLGVSGLRAGRPAHWSHMLAVRDAWRSRGLGSQLKAFQRTLLLEAGIEVCYWTYDPIIAGNAHFNINRLAAFPVEYVPDMYGSDTGSELHSGLGTDRHIVRWDLTDPRVDRALAEHVATVPAPDVPTVNAAPDDDTLPVAPAVIDAPAIRIAIPVDIQRIKAERIDLARLWRENTRTALTTYFERGYLVTGFHREPHASGYILTRPDALGDR